MPDGGPSIETLHQRHVVVFDVNVYLDVAHLLGAPFSWEKFDAAAARSARQPVPHPHGPAYDSLRSIAVCTSGIFAGSERVEVFSSSHIDGLVRGKALQSPHPDSSGHRGLGWASEDAEELVSVLVHSLCERTVGGMIGQVVPDGNPPLDHEDGLVYGACRKIAGDDPLCNVYCVTRDRGFIDAGKVGRLSTHTRVLHPQVFVQLVRAARSLDASARMRPRR